MSFGHFLNRIFRLKTKNRPSNKKYISPITRLEILEDRYNPAQLFWNNLSPSLGGSPTAIANGDFNKDGNLDFAVANSKGLTIGLGQGIGSFGPTQTMTLGATPASLVVGDVNGDGKIDLIAVNQAADSITILPGNGDGTFAAGKTISVGSGPVSASLGDFNGDTKLDLVVANSGGNSLSVLLGDGTGAFQAGSTLPVGNTPSWVSVGDFNKDGKTDLVAANSLSNTLSLFNGNGDGSFASTGAIAVGAFPKSVVVGDFNKDGNPDLATANYSGNSVSILSGNGDGKFKSAVTVSVGAPAGPQMISVGDFNKDGNPDLVTANYFGNNVAVLSGNGDGSFQAPVKYSVGNGTQYLTVGDFDNDSRMDIATVNNTDDSVSFLFGRSDGAFFAATNVLLGASSSSLAIADFNGDGKKDLISANTDGSTVSLLLNQGNGAFGNPTNFAVGSKPTAIAVGDLNGDNKADIVTINAGANTITVLLGFGDGTFQFPQTTKGLSNPTALGIADLNGDTRPDLVVANAGTNSFLVFLANANGGFNTPGSVAANGTPQSLSLGDFNGDKKTDIASSILGGNAVSLLTGKGDGSFNAPTSFAAGSGSAGIASADATGDEFLDLVIANSTTDTLSYLAGNGNGTFKPAVSLAVGNNPASVAFLDVNGDKKADLISSDSSAGTVSVLLGNGNGTWKSPSAYTVGANPRQVVADDLDGNGNFDLVTANQGDGTLSILTGAGNGSFQSPASEPVGASPWAVVKGDFNGDGTLDLATANSGDNTVSVMLGLGDGNFGPLQSFSVGANPIGLTVADVNGDGKADLLAANNGGSTVSLLLGNGNGTFKASKSITVGPVPTAVKIGDVNGDGKADLLSANSGDSTLSIALGNGDGTFQSAKSLPAGGNNPNDLLVLDLNGDKKLDLVSSNSGSNSVTTLLGNGDGTFKNPSSFSVGNNPYSLATEDFNGDLKIDLVAANAGGTSVSVLLGNADGSFQGATRYSVGVNPWSVATGDVNGDGLKDIITANSGESSISVLLGDGKGGFSDPANYGVGASPYSVVLGDFNNDRRSDLAVANFDTSTVSVLLGISNLAPSFVSPATARFTEKRTGQFQLVAGGSPAPTFSLKSGTLPTGLQLDSVTGIISGMPARGTPGDYSITIEASNGVGSPASQVLTLTVAPSPGDPPVFLTPGAATFDYGKTGSFTVQVDGAPSPTLSISSGSLPSGITLDSKTGVLTGITNAGVYNFTITASNGVGDTASQAFTLTVNKANLTISADNKNKIYGDALPVLTATFTGLLNGDKPDAITGLTLTTTALASSKVGDYPITAANATSSNYNITFGNGTLSVKQAALTIKADDKTKVYGAALPALSVSYTGLVNGDKSSVVTGLVVTTTGLASSKVGTYKITASKATASNYSITFVDGNLEVTKAALTITGDNKTKTYGAALPTLTATTTGLVNGDNASVVSGLVLNTTALASSNVGNYKITPSQAVAANYAITFVDGTLSVTKAALTIRPDDKTKVYGAALPTLTATYTGLVNGDKSSVVSGLTLATTALASSNVGDYKITASKATATNYSITFVDGKLSITKAGLTIRPDDKTKVYGAALPALTVSYTGLVNNDKSTVVTGLVLGSTALATSNVGDYKITASKATATNYAITFVDGKMTVTKAALTIKADDKSKVYGAALPTLTATFTGLVNNDKSTVISGLSLATTALASSNAGDYKITASKATASNYNITFVDGKLTVTKAALTIKAEDKTKVYGAALPALTASYTGLVNNDKSSVVSGLSLATAALATSNVGTYKITASKGTASNYNITFVDGILSVTRAALTIKADDKVRLVGTANPAFTATFTGLTNGDSSSVVSGLTLTTTATTSSAKGNYPITAAGGTASNYAITFSNGVLTVGDVPKVTSIANGAFTYGNIGSFTFTASGLPAPTFQVSTGTLPAGLTLDSRTGILSGAPSVNVGTYRFSITASNVLGTSTPQAFTLTVNKAALTITPDNKSKIYGADLPTLTASYSGLVNGDTSAVVSGLALSTTALKSSKVGNYSITASKAIAANYNITFATGTLAVTKANLTITADNKTRNFGTTNPTLTATYSGLVNGDLPAAITGLFLATKATSTSPGGTYAITASGATNANYNITLVNGTLTVNQAPQITSLNKATLTSGAAGSFQLTASGFPKAAFSVIQGSLPTGVTLNATTGLLSALATVKTGTYAFTLQASNGIGLAATQLFTLLIK